MTAKPSWLIEFEKRKENGTLDPKPVKPKQKRNIKPPPPQAWRERVKVTPMEGMAKIELMYAPHETFYTDDKAGAKALLQAQGRRAFDLGRSASNIVTPLRLAALGIERTKERAF